MPTRALRLPSLISGDRAPRAAAILIGLLALLPILAVRYLPLHDYPFHLARIIILARLDNPFFQRFYSHGSFLLPNIGMDAVAVPLSALVGPEPASRIFVGLTLLTPLFGTICLHRAAHGRWSAWPLLAVLFLHNGIFRFGFLNYLFGMGLALAAAGWWMVLRPGLGRFVIGLVAAILLLWCHFEAFAVFAVIVGGLEIGRAWIAWGKAGAGRALGDLLLASLPFVVCLGLFALFSPTAAVTGAGFGYEPGHLTKLVGGLFSLSSGNRWLDGLSVLVILGIGGWLLMTRNLAVSTPLAFATAAMVLAFFAVPSDIMGALYADVRLAPPLALLAIAALDIRRDAPAPIARAVLALAILLGVVRASVLTSQWRSYNAQIAPIARAVGGIESGATLFAATADPYPALIADTPDRRAVWQPPLKHVAAFAVLGSPVFVPMTWANPTQQPLAVRPAYQPVYDWQGNPKKVFTRTALLALLGEINRHLTDGGWPALQPAYLLVVGYRQLEPLHLPPFVAVAAQGDRFLLLRFTGQP
ncbi:MAG TPA: hypothetical protein VHV26_02150 [Rhizomicrobium sp.]|nr:hypothetical protein [Rhizomicrobium sp.]